MGYVSDGTDGELNRNLTGVLTVTPSRNRSVTHLLSCAKALPLPLTLPWPLPIQASVAQKALPLP